MHMPCSFTALHPLSRARPLAAPPQSASFGAARLSPLLAAARRSAPHAHVPASLRSVTCLTAPGARAGLLAISQRPCSSYIASAQSHTPVSAQHGPDIPFFGRSAKGPSQGRACACESMRVHRLHLIIRLPMQSLQPLQPHQRPTPPSSNLCRRAGTAVVVETRRRACGPPPCIFSVRPYRTRTQVRWWSLITRPRCSGHGGAYIS
jgi:hypothetical protein